MADRTPIVAANWKMHKTHLEAIQAVQKLSYLLDRDDAERVEVVICPPFIALRSVQTTARWRHGLSPPRFRLLLRSSSRPCGTLPGWTWG